MSFYCPECGGEVTDGIKCPDCGRVDEECSDCGISLDTNSWFCRDCETPRDNCIECGTVLEDDTCPNCDTVRPNLCDSCGEFIERGTMQCNSCGHKLGGKFRSRAKKAKYIGYLIAGLILIPNIYRFISSDLRNPIFITALLIPPIFVIVITKLVTWRWNNKAKKQVY